MSDSFEPSEWADEQLNVWLIIDISPAILNMIPASYFMSRMTEFSFLKASIFIKLVQ